MALAPGPKEFICSARGCTEPAVWMIEWSNPNIHYGRTKKWLACDQHREELKSYFAYRNFPYEVTAFTAPPSES